MPGMTGFSHVAFTVSDVSRSKDWYMQVFDDAQPLMDVEGFFLLAHPAGLLIGMRQHEGQDNSEFTHLRTGLDHIGFAVTDKDELEKWRARFDELGVNHSGVEQSEFGWHLNFRDPDNIPLEMFCVQAG
jgi:catechol 2,3-dioxygenase-like lactoylglutathione lyase family enzyme